MYLYQIFISLFYILHFVFRRDGDVGSTYGVSSLLNWGNQMKVKDLSNTFYKKGCKQRGQHPHYLTERLVLYP